MKFEKLKTDQLNRLNTENYKLSSKSGVYIVIDQIRSGLNIGSVFRTADAFSVNKIFITGISPVPPNKEILKSALGSTQSVEWEYAADAIELVKQLKQQNFAIVAAEQTKNSTALNEFKQNTNQPIAVIFGNEVEGVSHELLALCDAVIEIPQFGTKHSLNVAVSAGIILWHLSSQRLLNS